MDEWIHRRQLHPSDISAKSLLRHLVILLLLVFFPDSVHVIKGQRLPSRDEDFVQYSTRHKEVFYDTRRLPDGEEKRLYLSGESSVYFLVEDVCPLALIITPCTNELISWRLLFQEYPSDRSGDGQGTDEILGQGQAPKEKRPERNRYIVHTGDITGKRISYNIGETIAGLYTLEFIPSKGSASIKVFGSTSLVDHPYPEMPLDPEVKVTATSAPKSLGSRTALTMSWKPSPTETQHGENVEYCVVISNKEHFETQCAALAYKYGDRSPKLPPYVGFGFPGEKQKYKQVNIKPKSKYDIFHGCVGRKNTFTYSDVQYGKKYNFEVFVVNTKTNASSAYVGSRKKVKTDTLKYEPLTEGKVQSTYLSPNVREKYFKFTLPKRTSQLCIAVQPCSGPVEVEIIRNGHVMNTTITDDVAIIVYSPVKKGRYVIHMSAVQERTNVKVAYSKDVGSFPFPLPPADNTISVVPETVTCTSMTVSWRPAVGHHQYCVYVQKASDFSVRSRSFQHHNRCRAKKQKKKKHKYLCTERTAPSSDTMVQNISGLEPGLAYVVNIYMSKPGQHWTRYKPANISTELFCSM